MAVVNCSVYQQKLDFFSQRKDMCILYAQASTFHLCDPSTEEPASVTLHVPRDLRSCLLERTGNHECKKET